MTEMAPEPNPRISVSREALRAELAEMELRLRLWIASELEEKASAKDLEKLRGEFNAKAAWADGLMPLRDEYIKQLDLVAGWRMQALAGHFTDAQEQSMALVAKQVLDDSQKGNWSRRERMFAIVAVLSTFMLTLLTVLTDFNVIGR